MPLYVYRCASCEHVFEELVTASDAAATVAIVCPECGAEDTERQLTTFAVQSGGSKAEPTPFCNRCGEDRPPCGL